MAGAGQPFYMPLLWPFGHIKKALTSPKDEKPSKNVALGELDTFGHLTAFTASFRSFAMAYIAMYWLFDDDQYPAFGRGNMQ